MTVVQRPRLGRWGDRGLPPRDDHVVIFVHGILSDSSTFDKLLPHLVVLDPTYDLDFWIFDYDCRQTLAVSGDQLAQAISEKSFGKRRVDIVGHSMGGLVARMAVLRHHLQNVVRIVTLATPNHGTISGTQLNLLGQMIALGFRRVHPIYARAPGIIDLTNVPVIMRDELQAMYANEPARLDGKSYVSIPAQYFHSKRQLGDPLPSLMMGGPAMLWKVVNALTPFRINLTPVHDGIVEERSNQLHPAPAGCSNEGTYMVARNAPQERILHATHEAASECDHVTVTACPEIADLIQAVLRADKLEAADIDPHLKGPPNRVALRPTVV
jgi:pimeloyl-ACP methyl ester carboxylesterase